MFGPSGVDGGWLRSDYGPWSCAVRRVQRSVLVSPSPLVLRSGGTGYGSGCFGRRACLGTTLLPVVPTYSRGSGSTMAMQYVARRDLRLSFPWSVHTGTCLVAKETVCDCNRSCGAT